VKAKYYFYFRHNLHVERNAPDVYVVSHLSERWLVDLQRGVIRRAIGR
jgi:hypothetical protein